MKKEDALWGAALGLVIAGLLFPGTHDPIMHATKLHPFLMGFCKFAILASMGELLAIRIMNGNWSVPRGMAYRFLVWGIMGVCLVEMFAVFAAGVSTTLQNGLLPGSRGDTSHLATALWTSVLLNVAFGPLLMAGHRFADTYLDLAQGRLRNLGTISLAQVSAKMDWEGFIGFVCLRTIPLFWIPAHTITFLLPQEYRILYAAFLSLALGIILAFAKRSKAVEASSEKRPLYIEANVAEDPV